MFDINTTANQLQRQFHQYKSVVSNSKARYPICNKSSCSSFELKSLEIFQNFLFHKICAFFISVNKKATERKNRISEKFQQ